MQYGLYGKSTGDVKMVPAVAGAVQDALGKRIAVSRFVRSRCVDASALFHICTSDRFGI